MTYRDKLDAVCRETADLLVKAMVDKAESCNFSKADAVHYLRQAVERQGYKLVALGYRFEEEDGVQ